MDVTQPPGQRAPLGALLAQTAAGVVQAQRVLDADAAERVTLYAETPHGDVTLPPLWFRMRGVTVDLELSATLSRATPGAPAQLDARLLNPAAVSLFGYRAASGLRVRFTLEPQDGAPPPT